MSPTILACLDRLAKYSVMDVEEVRGLIERALGTSSIVHGATGTVVRRFLMNLGQRLLSCHGEWFVWMGIERLWSRR